ncbi:MAG: hypothetical protein JRN37_06545 [Nitrososphaerota archaeon]|jgi:hypothetical protein|nr:hypothetical protein [Nitrososphaerota archaeon]MDG7038795.1 hypothetical protein [Nitrososphaerota archaeon]
MKDRYDIKINRYTSPVMILTKEEERQLAEILINHLDIINHTNINYAEENKVRIYKITLEAYVDTKELVGQTSASFEVQVSD